MSKTTMIRYQTRPQAADENRELISRVFEELAERRPSGLSYTALQLANGAGFVHVVTMEGDADPLAGLAAFAAFTKGIADRAEEAPVATAATVIGSYRSDD
jgi:hypothetical protein